MIGLLAPRFTQIKMRKDSSFFDLVSSPHRFEEMFHSTAVQISRVSG